MNDPPLPRIGDRQAVVRETVTTMSKPAPQTCEVKIEGVWQAVTLPEAHARHGSAEKRCPACHGRVIVSGTYTGAFKLSLAHRKSHDGCLILLKAFRGTARPHPQAVA